MKIIYFFGHVWLELTGVSLCESVCVRVEPIAPQHIVIFGTAKGHSVVFDTFIQFTTVEFPMRTKSTWNGRVAFLLKNIIFRTTQAVTHGH